MIVHSILNMSLYSRFFNFWEGLFSEINSKPNFYRSINNITRPYAEAFDGENPLPPWKGELWEKFHTLDPYILDILVDELHEAMTPCEEKLVVVTSGSNDSIFDYVRELEKGVRGKYAVYPNWRHQEQNKAEAAYREEVAKIIGELEALKNIPTRIQEMQAAMTHAKTVARRVEKLNAKIV